MRPPVLSLNSSLPATKFKKTTADLAGSSKPTTRKNVPDLSLGLQSMPTKVRKIILGTVIAAGVGIAFVYAQTDIAVQSIRFDLRKIGESIYEAHRKNGRWPDKIADLEGTEYLNMPYRKVALEQGVFVVIWATELDPDPAANRDRLLAYSNGGLLGRLGFVWGCRGDLSIERLR